LRFCPEYELQIQDVSKFCSQCCSNVLIENKNAHIHIENKNENNNYSKGKNFERHIANILEEQNFNDIKLGVKIIGKTQLSNEIDILAKYNDAYIAFECKNYAESIDKNEIIIFWSKLKDITIYYKGIFVTNSIFTKDAREYAKTKNIRLWDKKTLKFIHSKTFPSSPFIISNETTNDSLNGIRDEIPNIPKLFREKALPLRLTFKEVSKINIDNPNFLKIVSSNLLLEPFYKIQYTITNKKNTILI